MIQDRRVIGGLTLPLLDGDPDAAAEARLLLRLRMAVGRTRPDAVVVDLELPIHRGVKLLRAITTICPEAEIVTRVESRNPGVRFFSVRPNSRGLCLRPLTAESMVRIPPFLQRTSPLLEAAEKPIA